MKIRNINDKWGDPIDFDSVEEMEDGIRQCGYEVPEDGLREGVDYEIVESAGIMTAEENEEFDNFCELGAEWRQAAIDAGIPGWVLDGVSDKTIGRDNESAADVIEKCREYLRDQETLQSVQRLGDGQCICSDCWAREKPDKPEPENNWILGECDYCESDNATCMYCGETDLVKLIRVADGPDCQYTGEFICRKCADEFEMSPRDMEYHSPWEFAFENRHS